MSQPDLIQTMQMSIDPEMIDLGVGQPQLRLLPLERVRQAAAQLLAQGDASFLQYGAEPGDGYLRRALADYLAREYGFAVEANHLFITNGASLGLDLACTLFTQAGDTIFVEEPSYFLALRIFADHRLRVVPIPMDADGMRVDVLEAGLARTRPALVYTIPTFQNPSGVTLSEERRARLADLSRQHGFLVVADEVYHFLSYTARPPTALAGYAERGNILSLGSFSKILAPGLRLGWIHSHPERIQAFINCGLLDSGGGLNPFTGAVVRGMVQSGELDANIRELRSIYAARVAVMADALRELLPEVTFQTPQGGYFFWVQFPAGVDAADLMRRAEVFKVSFRPGARFSASGGLRNCARLCFAFYEADEIREGVARLAKALRG